MSVGFSEQQCQQIKDNCSLWWAGRLDRPLVQVVFTDCELGRNEPALPGYAFTSFYDLDVPAESIVNLWDYDLSCLNFFGDAFPCI